MATICAPRAILCTIEHMPEAVFSLGGAVLVLVFCVLAAIKLADILTGA